MYTTKNFKSKAEFKRAIAAGEKIRVYSTGYGNPPENGKCCVEGPHFPKPHSWYAEVTLKDGIVINVK